MIRKKIKDFLSTEIPNGWDYLSNTEIEDVDSKFRGVFGLEPLTKEEALAVANHMGMTDLDGLGQSLGGSIASASEWPYRMTELFHIDNFSEPLCDIKRETFYAGACYKFHSFKNVEIVITGKNYEEQLALVKDGIDRIDCQMLISIFMFQDPEDVTAGLLSKLELLFQKFFNDYPEAKNEIIKNSYLESTLKMFKIKI